MHRGLIYLTFFRQKTVLLEGQGMYLCACSRGIKFLHKLTILLRIRTITNHNNRAVFYRLALMDNDSAHDQLLLMLLLLLFTFCCLSSSVLAQDTETFRLHPQDLSPHAITFVGVHVPAGELGGYYGLTTQLELGAIPATKSASLTLSNLQPAHFYYVQPFVWTGTDTIWGALDYHSTQSQSTGVIKVFFNQGIDPSYSTGSSPDIVSGGSNIENAIITKINQAKYSIDAAIFNTTRTAIVNALKAAHNRGIQIRFVANAGTFTSNAALVNSQPPFPVAYVNMADLMHNKFVVIDAQSVDSSWVWTGSCNWTYTDMFTNYNNVVLLQDQALAQAYTMEFEELWGGSGATFNASNSRVGAAKTDNTPHIFNIGGRVVESYFSPSDNVTAKISGSIYSADNDLEFCILAFTRNDIGTAVRNRHQSGIAEHGLMENINDNGSEFSYLTSVGVNLLADNQPTALHHKYAIVDAGDVNSDPLVVTGSHNWTTAAESRNDENTLIIHDATIANIFLQEFALRWCQINNNVGCALPFARFNNTTTLPRLEEGLTIYPNPASQLVYLELDEVAEEVLTIEIYNLAGQLLGEEQQTIQGKTTSLDVSHLWNGSYILRVKNGARVYQAKLLLLR